MTKQRISWIDIAKAIGLAGVIMVHSLPRDGFTSILTGSVIPIFFILYGIGHNNEKHRGNLKKYITARFRGLMIPYFILTAVMILLYWVTYPWVDFGFTPLDFVFWSIYGNGPPGRITHLWFLRVMFFAIILFSFLDKYLYDKPLVRYIILLGSPQVAIMLKSASGVQFLPYAVDAVFVALSFMMLGNELRRFRHMASWSISPSFDAVAVPVSLVVYTILSWANGFVNIGESLYGQWIYLYFITGFLGTYVMCVLSYYISIHSRRLTAIATSFNRYGQEVYEIHPLIIETNVQLLGELTLLNAITVYPGTPLFLLNLPMAIFLSWFIGAKVVSRSSILRFVFTGRSQKPPERKPSVPISVPTEEGGEYATPPVTGTQ
ncbi:MAG: acyltransferase family protein [Candidatus Thorarchaeota archaeon]